MELPRRLPEKREFRRILGEFYDVNKNRQWFNRAELVELHSTHMKPTLEIYCDYNPHFELNAILEFTTRYNIAHEIIDLSHRDK